MAAVDIQTSRFGRVQCLSDDLIHFPEGILGFANLRNFVLLDDPSDEIFAWLQSCEVPQIAFPVLEPELFAANYQLNLTKHDLESLDMAGGTDRSAFRSFTIITVPEDPTQMTANMKAPVCHQHRKADGSSDCSPGQQSCDSRADFCEVTKPCGSESASAD